MLVEGLANAVIGVVPLPALNVIVAAGVLNVALLQTMLYVKPPITTGCTAGVGVVSTSRRIDRNKEEIPANAEPANSEAASITAVAKY